MFEYQFNFEVKYEYQIKLYIPNNITKLIKYYTKELYHMVLFNKRREI